MNSIPHSPALCACGCGTPVTPRKDGKQVRFCRGHKHAPVIPPSAVGLKRCTTCQVEKPLEAFHHRRDQADGHAPRCIECAHIYQGDYRTRNAAVLKVKKAAWQRTNRARLNAQARAHQEANYIRQQQWRAANRERRNATERAWRAANPNRTLKAAHNWRAKNKEAWATYNARWRAEHPDVSRECAMRRFLRKKNQTVGKVDYAAILARDGYVCHICGGAVERSELQFDHIIPLAKGGPHSMDNIAVSHALCNRRKGAKILHQSTAK